MPIIQSAKKALRSSSRKRVFNDRRRRAMRDAIKKTRKLSTGGDKAGAQKSLSEAYKAIDKALKRGVIKKNTAARRKSRIAAAMNKLP